MLDMPPRALPSPPGWMRMLRRHEASLISSIDFSNVLMQGLP